MNRFYHVKPLVKKIDTGEGEQEVSFYPVPIGTILKMKTAGKALSKLVATLMTDKSTDVAVEKNTVVSDKTDKNGEAYVNTNTVQSEISPSLASYRHKQLTESVEGLIENLTAPETVELIAEIIVKSVRDDFQDGDEKDLTDKMELGVMFKLLAGAIEASAGGIKGLGKFLSPHVKEQLQDLTVKAKEVVGGDQAEKMETPEEKTS